MNRDYASIAARIGTYLDDLERVTARVTGSWSQASLSPDDYLIDAAALNLHSFGADVHECVAAASAAPVVAANALSP